MIGEEQNRTIGTEAEHLAGEIHAALIQWIESRKRMPNAPPDLRQFTIETLTHAIALLRAGALGESGCLTLLNRWSLHGPPLPHWDEQRRILRVGQHAVKHFRRPSPNQEAILAAFEEEGWPRRIDDPLPPHGEQPTKCRLHDTIKWLNRHHQPRLIRFFGDGTGEGVYWEFLRPSDLAPPAGDPKRRRATK